MPARGFRVVQRPQRIPSGMKFRVDNIRRLRRHMPRDDPVGLAELSEIGKPAGDDALFVPPGAGVDELARSRGICPRSLAASSNFCWRRRFRCG